MGAGLIHFAHLPQRPEAEAWVYGLLALIPLEFVRALVFSILGDTFKDYQNPIHAVYSFLFSMGILSVLGLIVAVHTLGFQGFYEAASDMRIWKFIGPPAAVMLTDGLVALFFFRGFPNCRAARIEAAADDCIDWLNLMVIPAPVIMAVIYGGLMLLRANGSAVPVWIPDFDGDGFLTFCLYYAAVYFFGKGALLAHVHTRAFNRTGERVLSAGWVQFLIVRKEEDRIKNMHDETRKAAARVAALQIENILYADTNHPHPKQAG